MASVNYTLRIDESDKQNAERVFKDLGMTFSTGINIYIKTVGRQQRIPFELALTELSNTATPSANATKDEKWAAFMALEGALAGHEVDLNKEREERMLSQ